MASKQVTQCHLQLKSFDARVDVRVCVVEVFSSPHGDVELPVGLIAKDHSNVVRAVLPFHVQSAAVVHRTVSSATCQPSITHIYLLFIYQLYNGLFSDRLHNDMMCI